MLLWLGGLIVAAALVVLLTPVRVEVEVAVGSGAAGPPVRARIGWLFFGWRIGDRPSRRDTGPAQPARGAERRRKRPPVNIAAILRTPGLLARCAQLIGEVRHALRPRRAMVRARIGLDDPCETGLLAGALAAGTGWWKRRKLDVEITPDFSEAIVAVQAQIAWSIRPVVVLWPIATFLAAPVVWRAARRARAK